MISREISNVILEKYIGGCGEKLYTGIFYIMHFLWWQNSLIMTTQLSWLYKC